MIHSIMKIILIALAIIALDTKHFLYFTLPQP